MGLSESDCLQFAELSEFGTQCLFCDCCSCAPREVSVEDDDGALEGDWDCIDRSVVSEGMLLGALGVVLGVAVVVELLGDAGVVDGAVCAAATPLSAKPATASAINWRFICPPCQTCSELRRRRPRNESAHDCIRGRLRLTGAPRVRR